MNNAILNYLQQILCEVDQVTSTGINNMVHLVNVKLLCDQIRKVMAEQQEPVRKDAANDGN